MRSAPRQSAPVSRTPGAQLSVRGRLSPLVRGPFRGEGCSAGSWCALGSCSTFLVCAHRCEIEPLARWVADLSSIPGPFEKVQVFGLAIGCWRCGGTTVCIVGFLDGGRGGSFYDMVLADDDLRLSVAGRLLGDDRQRYRVTSRSGVAWRPVSEPDRGILEPSRSRDPSIEGRMAEWNEGIGTSAATRLFGARRTTFGGRVTTVKPVPTAARNGRAMHPRRSRSERHSGVGKSSLVPRIDAAGEAERAGIGRFHDPGSPPSRALPRVHIGEIARTGGELMKGPAASR